MTTNLELILVAASAMLLLSVMLSKASGRIGVPSLLVFLLIGMLAGSEISGFIYFDDALLAQSLGVIALAFILFAGGLDTEWEDVRQAFVPGFVLATAGVFLTAILVGLFVYVAFGFSWLQSLLIGAIVSSTDAAAVFSVLRAKGVSLRNRLKATIELESGSNDPMAVFLTIGLTNLLLNPESTALTLLPLFFWQMLLGAGLGYLFSRVISYLINNLLLEYEGLYPVLTLSSVLLCYGATTTLGGNGFLAVYLMGLLMKKDGFIHQRSLTRFHDGLAWLMQIAMFLTLGLLVFPSQLLSIIGLGLLLSFFLIFIARPIAVYVTLAFSSFDRREKAMISWVGLRGAVPIILATFPSLSGIPEADTIFNVVFFVVLTSVLFQGTTIPVIARLLKVDVPRSVKQRSPLEFEVTHSGIDSTLVEIEIGSDWASVNKPILNLHLPHDVLIVLINRDNKFIIPGGSTVVQAGDTLMLLANKQSMLHARDILERFKD